jgi:hypothetical protein
VSSIEDLLRDAFQADAQTMRAEDVPDLATSRGRARPARSSRMLVSRLAVPLTAAAAVVAVVLTAELVAPRLMTGPGVAGQPLSPQTRSALFGSGAGTRQPPYLIGEYNSSGSVTSIGVYSVRTGRMVSHIVPPRAGLTFTASAATGNDLSFVVAASPRAGSCVTWFYRLTLTQRGQAASLVPLRVPEAHGEIVPPNGLTASASGQTIAYTANGCGSGKGWLGVIELGSRTVRSWKADAEFLWSLSLSADGQLVLYVDSTIYGGDGSVRLLPTSARPGLLSQRARVVVPGDEGVAADGSVALTPDGKTIIACTDARSTSPGPLTATLSALTAATGRPLGVLYRWPGVAVAPCIVSSVAAGRYLVVSDISAAIGIRLDLATGQARKIPGSGDTLPIGVSW